MILETNYCSLNKNVLRTAIVVVVEVIVVVVVALMINNDQKYSEECNAGVPFQLPPRLHLLPLQPVKATP